ncbi:MAG TPA: alkaline phosphatase D family protein [Kofleriaceae bacterium]|nr:alkaline phosphatase D family protein [Kofleriaceae bacterium]
MPDPLSRRDFLRAVGATAWLVTCNGNDAVVAATAALDPDETSVVVAIWGERPGALVEAEAAAGGRTVATGRVALDGQFGALVLTGLPSDTVHDVTVRIAGVVVGAHRVRTAPRADDPRPVRVAISADYDPSPAFASGVIDALIAAEPELLISIGDFPYTDNGPPAMTVPTYRERHLDLRTHPPVRALLESCGLCAIYDDHEVRNNWDGLTQIEEPERYAAAMQVWDEFFPQRAAVGEVRYRRWRWGAHLECFLLDCRRFRSANRAVDDASKTMLGATQLQWLIDGVTSSTAAFKLILTSIPLDYGAGDDHWASFTTERDAMFAALVGTPGVLFVSGDQHWFAAQRHAFGIREMQIGPLGRGFGVPPPAVPSVLFRSVQRYNAGLIDITGDQLTTTGLGADGERFYHESFSAADLTPRAP